MNTNRSMRSLENAICSLKTGAAVVYTDQGSPVWSWFLLVDVPVAGGATKEQGNETVSCLAVSFTELFSV